MEHNIHSFLLELQHLLLLNLFSVRHNCWLPDRWIVWPVKWAALQQISGHTPNYWDTHCWSTGIVQELRTECYISIGLCSDVFLFCCSSGFVPLLLLIGCWGISVWLSVCPPPRPIMARQWTIKLLLNCTSGPFGHFACWYTKTLGPRLFWLLLLCLEVFELIFY